MTTTPLRTEDFFEELDGWKPIACWVKAGLRGQAPTRRPRRSPDPAANFPLSLLQWATSAHPLVALQWDALEDHGSGLPSRDDLVEELWRGLLSSEGLQPARDRLDRLGREEAYRHRLFGWFLSRFHLGAALRLYLPHLSGARLGGVFLALLAAVVLGAASLLGLAAGTPQAAALLVALAAGAVLGAAALALRRRGRTAGSRVLPWRMLLRLPIPRLGAAVGLGYLFLAAAPELVQLLVSWHKGALAHLAVDAAGLGLAWGYALLHIDRRVHPALPRRQLGLRAATLTGIAAGYAALGLAAAAPVLFSPAFLATAGPGAPTPFTLPELHRLALCSVVALALGIVLELAWGREPITEPL